MTKKFKESIDNMEVGLDLINYNEHQIGNIDIINYNSKRFGCGLLLENHSKSINIQPAEFSHRKECDVIIGMDIIQYGLFILDKGKFTFTIEQLNN